jgi:hypothetical protein
MDKGYEPVGELRPVDEHVEWWTSHACHPAGMRPSVNATTSSPMNKRKLTNAWSAYKIAKVGKRLGSAQAATEEEALASAQREYAKTEAEKKRIYCKNSDAVWRAQRQ